MSRTVVLPPESAVTADHGYMVPGLKPAGWWHEADGGSVVCDLCPRGCSLAEGKRGFCFVRQNVGGQLITTTYGRSSGFCIDPIEKKPLNHFYPGSSVLSFGTAGCNLGCRFCQNWEISKSREIDALGEWAEPQTVARAAELLGCQSVAFTYNDPVVWAEYAIDCAKACHAAGVKTVAVTAGYVSPAARKPLFEVMDAANVDLKGFTEEFYRQETGSRLAPVLETLVWLARESNVWLEVTNLLIPGKNDSAEELKRMSAWLVEALGPEVPLHFTAFHPDFRMQDVPPTPPETLAKAHEIARSAGLKYVYTGNTSDQARQSTYCPGCGELLVERDGYSLGAYGLKHDRCRKCGLAIAGRFGDGPGDWGPRRQPVRISAYATSQGPPAAESEDGLPIRPTINRLPIRLTVFPPRMTVCARAGVETFALTPEQERLLFQATGRRFMEAVLDRPPAPPRAGAGRSGDDGGGRGVRDREARGHVAELLRFARTRDAAPRGDRARRRRHGEGRSAFPAHFARRTALSRDARLAPRRVGARPAQGFPSAAEWWSSASTACKSPRAIAAGCCFPGWRWNTAWMRRASWNSFVRRPACRRRLAGRRRNVDDLPGAGR